MSSLKIRLSFFLLFPNQILTEVNTVNAFWVISKQGFGSVE
jgi:hypothetical protein